MPSIDFDLRGSVFVESGAHSDRGTGAKGEVVCARSQRVAGTHRVACMQ